MYATPTDVRVAANPAFDPSSPQPDPTAQDAAALTDAQLSAAISEASATVDNSLRARYAVPVPDPAPEIVKAWTVDIALYLATLTWLRHQNLDQRDPVQLRYDTAMTALAGVAAGKLQLDLPPADAGSGGGFAGVVDSGVGDGLFDGTDTGHHPAAVTGAIRPWDAGGYLYGWQ